MCVGGIVFTLWHGHLPKKTWAPNPSPIRLLLLQVTVLYQRGILKEGQLYILIVIIQIYVTCFYYFLNTNRYCINFFFRG